MEKYTGEKVRQRIAAKAIIEYMSKILILRGALPTYAEGVNTGKYNFPGGRIEPGEPFYGGFRREIFEETGLHVTIGDPVYVDEWFPKIGNEQNQIVGVFFACTAQTDEVRLGRENDASREHDAYQWINPVDHQDYRLMTPEDKALEAYLRQRQNM